MIQTWPVNAILLDCLQALKKDKQETEPAVVVPLCLATGCQTWKMFVTGDLAKSHRNEIIRLRNSLPDDATVLGGENV